MLVILSQNKEEETVWCQNQIIILRSFSLKISSYRNEKSTDTYEKTCLFRTLNTIIKQNINVILLDIYKDNIYEDVTKDVDSRFDTSNYELDKPLPKRKN